MIKCNRCSVTKTEDEYYRDRRNKSGRRNFCITCEKKRGRRIVPDHLRKRKTIRGLPPDGVTAVYKGQFVQESKAGKCCHSCGCYDHPKAMDYHHIDESTKSFQLSQVHKGKTSEVTLEEVINEIKKCIFLCANCHRELHAHALCLLT